MADPGIPLPVEGLTEGQLELLRLKRTADIEECFVSFICPCFIIRKQYVCIRHDVTE